VRLADLLRRRALVEVLVAVPLAGGDPPGRRALGYGELGQLVGDVHLLERGLVRKLVAEPESVVIQAEHHVERAKRRARLAQAHAQLVVAVADEAALAPGLFPGLVEGARRGGLHLEAALQLRRIGEQEAEAGVLDQRLAAVGDRVARAAGIVEGDRDLDGLAG